MKKNKIGVMKFLGLLCFAACTFLLLPQQTSAEEIIKINKSNSDVNGYKNIYYADGCICIETYDKVASKTSTRTYKTLGYSITRCALNTGTPHNGSESQYVIINRFDDEYQDIRTNEMVETTNGTQYWHNIWRYPISNILELVAEKGCWDWYNDIYNYYILEVGEDKCYLKLDGILTTCRDGIPQGYIYSDKTLSDDTYPNLPSQNNYYRDKLKGLGWANSTGIDGHYNLIIDKNGLVTEFPGDTDPEPPVPGPTALYETKNYSSSFDISKAIPSGEAVTNVVSAASFTGNNLEIKTVPKSMPYSVRYTYKFQWTTADVKKQVGKFMATSDKWKQYVGKPNYIIEDFKILDKVTHKIVYQIIPGQTYTQQVASGSFSMTASVYYQYLASKPEIYFLDSLEVKNAAYPDRSLVYNKDNMTIPKVSINMMLLNQSAKAQGLPYTTITDGGNVDINYAPDNSLHCSFYAPSNIQYINRTIPVSEETMKNSSAIQSIISNQLESDKSSVANEISRNTWSKNDSIIINDGKTSFTVMSSGKVTGAVVTSGGRTYTSPATAATSGNAYNTNYSMGAINANLTARRASASQTVTIPVSTENADFPTGMIANYTYAFKETSGIAKDISMHAGLSHFSGASVDSIYNHIMDGGILPGHVRPTASSPDGDGYPIRVHTPIVAPISIVKNDGNLAYEQTQLIEGYSFNPDAKNQLLLDNSYYIKWDNELWKSSTYDVTFDGLYDKYVKAKYMRFPFAVVYNNVLYERQNTGFTEWILIEEPGDVISSWNDGADISKYESADHWTMTPFYIPTFAEEGGLPGELVYVEVRVEAQNVDGRYAGSHNHAVQISQNSSKESYVAETRVPVQLSGVVYDFTITGSDNSIVYSGNLKDSTVDDVLGIYSFCPIKQEKKAGFYNRLGTATLRFLTDGTITNSLPQSQNLPLRDGQSLSFKNMGDIWRGQTFGYTIKTIANLDNPNDFISITPTFAYVTSDGEILTTDNNDILLYCDFESYEDIWTFDPDNWTPTKSEQASSKVSLSQDYFKEAFYDAYDSNAGQFGNWVQTSVQNENEDKGATAWPDTVSEQEYLNRENTSFTYNHVIIPASLRLLSGEWEQLAANIDSYFDRNFTRNNLETYTGIRGYDAEVEKRFKYSMQQWHSVYSVPMNLNILDVRDLGRETFDFHDYLGVGRYSELKDMFEDRKGKLIVGFDIVVYKNGQPYLSYQGKNPNPLNMWDREGYTEGDMTSPDGFTVPLRDGDVAVVDMRFSLMDYFEASIWNIN